MALESQADTATFKHFLDQVYHDKIIDDTYPVPPSAQASASASDQTRVPIPEQTSPPAPVEQSTTSVSSWLDRPTSLKPTLLNPNSGPSDYLALAINRNIPTSDHGAVTIAAGAPKTGDGQRAADHLQAQKALMADPLKMLDMLPDLLIQCDTNHDNQIDKAEIAAGLKKTDLPTSQLELLNVLNKGFEVIHQKEDHDSNPGINKFDMEVLARAMNSNLGIDPIYGHEAINSIPKSAASGLMASLYVAKKMDPKDRWLAVGIMTVGSVLLQEAFLGLNHLFHGNDSKYNEVRKNYLALQANYPVAVPDKPATPKLGTL